MRKACIASTAERNDACSLNANRARFCCFALQWSSSTRLWDCAAWRTSWRTRSRPLAWRRRPWGSYWTSWTNKTRKSTKSRTSWRVSWRIELFRVCLAWASNTKMEISFKYRRQTPILNSFPMCMQSAFMTNQNFVKLESRWSVWLYLPLLFFYCTCILAVCLHLSWNDVWWRRLYLLHLNCMFLGLTRALQWTIKSMHNDCFDVIKVETYESGVFGIGMVIFPSALFMH